MSTGVTTKKPVGPPTRIERPQARHIEYLKDLVIALTQKELKVRYKSSWLGYLWSVANPIAFTIIYWIAFGIVMRVQIPNYPLFLIAGLFPWHWLAHSLSAAPNIFLANASLIKKVCFPRHMLVAAAVLNDGLHFVLSIPVILGFVITYQLRPTWSWLIGIPILVLAQFLMVYGVSLAVASVNLFFRDLDRLTGLLVNFLFFLTPVAYSTALIPEQYRGLVSLNPVAPLMLSWQQIFLAGNIDWRLVPLAYLYALASLGCGFAAYWTLSQKFAEVV